ncbi:MAG TPA: hypothetical protein ENI99_06085 [Sedimenticola sp.]|nr:hypothetical protein [Sedimenticola sp.]
MKRHPCRYPLFLLLAALLLFSGTPAQAGGPGGLKKLVILGGVDPRDLPEPDSIEARLLATYCSQCHNLPNPKMYSRAEWPERFARMMHHADAMGKMPGFKAPTDDEKGRISAYLQKYGMQSIAADDPSLRDPDAFEFVWFCSSCHNLPDPAQHTPEEWDALLDRMVEHRRAYARPEMSLKERMSILKFLGKGKK